MKIESLFYAIEIADTGSFSQAARNLYLSQPNLTQAIKKIESDYNVTLFSRTSKGVVPTEEGEILIERFRIIKREYEQINGLLKSGEFIQRKTLHIATLNCSRTNSTFKALTQKYADSPIHFSFYNYTDLTALINVVEKGQVDFAIIGFLSYYIKSAVARLKSHGIEYHPLTDACICALVGKNNPLYHGPEIIRLEQLYDYNMIEYGDPEEDPSNSLPYVAGLSPHVKGSVHVTSSKLFYDIIESSSVVGLVTSREKKSSISVSYPNIRSLKLADCNVQAQFAWIKSKRVPLNPLANEALENLIQQF